MKPGISFLCAVMAALGIGIWQQGRLNSLHQRIPTSRESAITGEASPSRLSPADESAEAFKQLSSEGMDGIPEMIRLLATIRGTPDEDGKNPDSPEWLRISELMRGLGPGAALRMAESIDDPEMRKRTLGDYFALNPRGGFLILADHPETTPPHELFFQFGDWLRLDAAGALRWYRMASDQGNEIVQRPLIRFQAAVAESRIDPAQSIQHIRSLCEEKPKEVWLYMGAQEFALNFTRLFRNDSERSGFMKALSQASSDPSVRETLQPFRAYVVEQFGYAWRELPVREAVPLINQSFTSEEKTEFALRDLNTIDVRTSKWREWASWVATLDGPAGLGHPLSRMLQGAANRRLLPDPAWMATFPEGEVKTQAAATYAGTSRDPVAASHYLELLPAGEQRKQIAKKIASAWHAGDPAAAAFMEKEGIAR